jgi:uncharacterized protein (DUF58 family)
MARLPGVVVVVSDFRGRLEVGRPLRALAARHSVAAVEVRDPREATLPAVGRLRVVDPETGVQVEVDTRDRRLRERYAAREREEREAVRTEIRRAGVDHVVLSTEGPWLRELGGRLQALGGRPR